jgi:hypothetical protein
MKRILIGLVIGLVLLEAGRRLYRPADEAAAAGSAAYQAGDFATAEAKFRQAERETSNPQQSTYNRAAALYRLRRFEYADGSYQRGADDEALHAARADYDRGNCAFSEACKDEGMADPDLLEKTVRQYEACLAREGKVADAGSLFDDARHNLELSRLILAEFKEANKPAPGGEPSESGAKNDPFAPSNAEHPREERQTRECKQCKRGGCPKCKKNPGQKPSPQESAQRGDGPTPNPGDADNGKAPGKGKGQTEAKQADPGAGKKGKPGEGGKPNPRGRNGVGDAKESGTGPADESARPTKKGAPREGKMVGPDGVTYERRDKPSQAGSNDGRDNPADAPKQPEPGGKGGAGDQPPPGTVDKLFQPGSPRPNSRNDAGGMTSPQHSAQGDDTDGSGDPVERAAAHRLRQAIQRIEDARQARPAPPRPGEPPASNRRRDW